MIVMVRVLSRADIQNYRNFLEKGYLAAFYGVARTELISACSSFEQPMFTTGQDRLQLIFDDVGEGGPFVAEPWQIDEIADFIRAAHEAPEPLLLVAQCDGGRSRSGAHGSGSTALQRVGRVSFCPGESRHSTECLFTGAIVTQATARTIALRINGKRLPCGIPATQMV